MYLLLRSYFFLSLFLKKISFLLYKLLRIKEGTSCLARDNEKERKRETERKNIRWGLTFSYVLLCENFLSALESTNT